MQEIEVRLYSSKTVATCSEPFTTERTTKWQCLPADSPLHFCNKELGYFLEFYVPVKPEAHSCNWNAIRKHTKRGWVASWTLLLFYRPHRCSWHVNVSINGCEFHTDDPPVSLNRWLEMVVTSGTPQQVALCKTGTIQNKSKVN